MSQYYYYNQSIIFRGAVWPLGLLNYSHSLPQPLDNGTFAGVTNPIVTLGNVQVQRCDETEGLCITFVKECSLSLCSRQFETSVTNGTTNNTVTSEDFGCLSQVHSDYCW